MQYWLIKSEPYAYSWDDFVAKGGGMWDGVRSYEARNNLAAMKCGDYALFYHSNEGKEIVGLARVTTEHYPDPTSDNPRWVVVDFEPVQKLPKSVTLAQIKRDNRLQNCALIRQSRLSVIPLRTEEFDILIGLSHE